MSPLLKTKLDYYFLNYPIDMKDMEEVRSQMCKNMNKTEAQVKSGQPCQSDFHFDFSNNNDGLKAEIQLVIGENLNLKNEISNLKTQLDILSSRINPSQDEVLSKLNQEYNTNVKNCWSPILQHMKHDLNISYKNTYKHLVGELLGVQAEISNIKSDSLVKAKILLQKNDERFQDCMDQLGKVIHEAFSKFSKKSASQSSLQPEASTERLQSLTLKSNDSFIHKPSIPILDYTPKQFEILKKQYSDKDVADFIQEASINTKTMEDQLRYYIVTYFELNTSSYHQMIENFIYVKVLEIFE
eukprot:EST44606.1 Hypothetical protein SS50377_15611 [Spironucleus salmonicida]